MALERAFVQAGGLLIAGTDPTGSGGVVPGYSNQRQVELLVEEGFTPVEAIQVVTSNGAKYLGRERRIGSIVVGLQADLVVVTGNPAANIADIRNVETVFKQGVGFDPLKLIDSVKGGLGSGNSPIVKEVGMRRFARLAIAAMFVATTGFTPSAPTAAMQDATAMQSIGPLTFGPNDVLFAGDTQGAAIYALELGAASTSVAHGAKDVPQIDQKIAALLGTDAAAVSVTDLAVHPTTKNAYLAVMRGQGADARPALVRVDGNGSLSVVDLGALKSTKALLGNAPAAGSGRRNPRADAITDMSFVNGKLIVAGLSNEEFASKLRTIAYPFGSVDPGTSVEIYHGNHGQFETRSPVYAFVPYTVAGTPHLIAGYLCTPLVKFPVASLTGTQKVVGTTIAELGAGNRPLDMIVYKKDGREFLLMTNTSRGVMKIPTADFGSAAPITSRIGGTAGIGYETIASMTGIEQLDLLDAQRTIVLARAAGALNLQALPLP